MKETREPSLASTAYQRIKTDIVECAFDPGQYIAQADLAARYKMGITPIREALRQLSQEGFVTSIPRLGYVVSHITAQDVQEIYEMRYLLETASVRLAAQRAAPELLAQIHDSAQFTYTYKDRRSYTEFLNRNAAFHSSIARAAGNQRLAEQVARILDELNRVFHLGLDIRDSADEMKQDHVALSEALRNRQAELAVQVVQAEIERSQARVQEALRRTAGPVVTSARLMELSQAAPPEQNDDVMI
ncbi:MAG TPA: GntR family transcriptional regulator [Anaerolineaceae bacterium]|nr:GntR family transcriptional regulator [Anaerolineaceae bacterium]HPN50950.1 GntR family transcriptional regulator [Anaerolineaceae bacterium]